MPIYQTNYPKSKRVAESLQGTPAVDEFIDREFATLFIVEAVGNSYEQQRPQRDKIGKQIDTALANGKLRSENGVFRFGDLISWIRTKQRLAHAADGYHAISHASAELTLPSPYFTAFGYSLPATLEACQDALLEAYRELNNVREENSRLHAQVAALLPFRAKVEKQSQDGRVNGAQGGRGNEKREL